MSDKYAALKQAAEKATPGEWCTGEHHEVIADAGLNANYYVASCSGPDHRANTKFIAAANPATILELLAERDADRARIADLEDTLEREREKPRRMASRISELEARTLTVKLPGAHHVTRPSMKNIQQAFVNGEYLGRKEVTIAFKMALAAAGISLNIEGE